MNSLLIDEMSDVSVKVLNNKHYHHPRYSSVGGKLTKLNDGWWCYCVKIETIDTRIVEVCDLDLVREYLNQEIADKVFEKIKNADRIPW